MNLTITGAEELARILNAPIQQATTAIAVAVGQALKDEIAPYPAQPAPRSPRRWYERGYGPRWLRKDGSLGGRKLSQTLGRRWQVRTGQGNARLVNYANYSGWVQSAEKQTRQHAATGWITDQQGIDTLTRNGTIQRIASRAINGVLRKVGGS